VTFPIRFIVYGHSQTAGSKTAFAVRRKDGSYVTRENGAPVVSVVDSNRKVASWKQEVRKAASDAYKGELLTCAVSVRICFVIARPKGHYRTGKHSHLLRDNAPPHHVIKPDVLKLTRAVEDALTGIIYRDDCATVRLEVEKTYGHPECCIVTIQPASAEESDVPQAARLDERTEALRPMHAHVGDQGGGMPSVRLPGLRTLHADSGGDSGGDTRDPSEVERRGTPEAVSVGDHGGTRASDGDGTRVAQP